MLHYHPFHMYISEKKQKRLLEAAVIVAAFLYPLSGFPQIVAVFQGSVEGVSVVSWLLFTLFAFIFFLYGMVHKIRPMIVTNFLWMMVDICIVAGILMHY